MAHEVRDAIVAELERYLAEHGDTSAGMGWFREEEVALRYDALLGMLREHPVEAPRPTLLDLGCGAGHLIDHARGQGLDFDYVGVDVSERFLEVARARHPDERFLHLDVLAEPDAVPEHDYAILCGVFTQRMGHPVEAMLSYVGELLSIVYRRSRVGLSFNVMSTLVDWERDDLFHAPFDAVAQLVAPLTRDFTFRHDYGLREYTVYLWKAPRRA